MTCVDILKGATTRVNILLKNGKLSSQVIYPGSIQASKEKADMRRQTCLKAFIKADWSSCRAGNTTGSTTAAPPGWFGIYLDSKNAKMRFNFPNKKSSAYLYRHLGENDDSVTVCKPASLQGDIRIEAGAEHVPILFGSRSTIWEDNKDIPLTLEEGRTTILKAYLRNEKVEWSINLE